jgi:septum formation protein
MNKNFILASTSIYRSELLKKLRIPFKTVAPDVDETPLPSETAKETSWRLSRAKAQGIAANHPGSLIIGSDQVVLFNEKQIGKPNSHENAVKQLTAMSGQTALYYTALTLLNTDTNDIQTEVAINKVHYRKLTTLQIENYLHLEKPYNCAGSVKSEGLGIAIIQSMEGDDPNAIIGLPLILLVSMLSKQGIQII